MRRAATAAILAAALADGAARLLKKGVSHCHIGEPDNPAYTCDDVARLNASWFYTWSATPPHCAHGLDTVEWVPQISALAEAEAIAKNVSILGPQKVGAILGPNEPNAGIHGPTITVEDAVAAWRQWFEPIAAKRGATHVVAPSAAHCACDGRRCSGGGGANSPTGYCDEAWIHEFLGNCTGCRIDAIGVHWYPFFRDYNDTIDPCGGANVSVCVDHFKSHLEVLAAYGKPLWITEFCAPTVGRMPDADAPKAEVPFLKAALRAIEEVPLVERVAPFSARIGSADFAGCTMFEMHPSFGPDLTAAGEVYAAWTPAPAS